MKFVFLKSNRGSNVPVNPDHITHIDYFYDKEKIIMGRCIVSFDSQMGLIVQGNTPQEIAEKIMEQLGQLKLDASDTGTE